MRLESAIGKPVANARGSVSAKAQRHFNKRRRAHSSWVVVVPGTPAKGDTIHVARKDGTTTKLWVQNIIAPANERHDGQSVVAVSKVPVMAQERPAREAAPMPKPPRALTQRNPRVCEECEGPCRPGAGVCDGCRRSRGADST
jgi:hypothetical protein